MSAIRTLILSHSEKHLARYRENAKVVKEEVGEEYRSYLPLLEICYARAKYWHGTGHYHYQHPGDSRYGTVHSTRTINVLDSILEIGGLANHQDLWVRTNTRKTVSLAPSRMHARLYAHIHLFEGVWLKYVFGGTRFWMGFFFYIAVSDIVSQISRGQLNFIRQVALNKNFFKQFRTWASALRDLTEFKTLPMWRAYDLRSDIKGNHPILFGIKKEGAEGEKVMPFLRRFEVRVTENIPLKHFTHIEVPQAHVEEVRAALNIKGISLPVIPLEYGELYSSQFSLKKLAYV